MEKMLGVANTAILVFVAALVGTVMLAYPLSGYFSMPAQIAAHIGTLLFATGVKISYIIRLVSLKSLGRPVH